MKLSEVIEWILPGATRNKTMLTWPPDSFGLAAYIVQRYGGYVEMVNSWPPTDFCEDKNKWCTEIQGLGVRWRNTALEQRMPNQIHCWWDYVFKRQQILVQNIRNERRLVDSLIQIMAAADEASNAIGPNSLNDAFNSEVIDWLGVEKSNDATLCKSIEVSRVRVLPKFHTPQTGITIRSLSHYLALVDCAEVTPRWIIPTTGIDGGNFNFLLIPYPWTVSRSQFSMVKAGTDRLGTMNPDRHGFFDFAPSDDDAIIGQIAQLVETAKNSYGPIHGLILPELALTTSLSRRIKDEFCHRGMFIISGVHGDPDEHGQSSNYVSISIPEEFYPLDPENSNVIHEKQFKHHRWQLDYGQIHQYGIGCSLDSSVKWWESFPVGNRDLLFITLNKHLTICVLICEDLAKQDPVASLIRSVGPNLVISLLMDSAQISQRWPGRYAMVLADDPGSSVLTFTSAGMVSLVKMADQSKASRSIALWKDAKHSSAIPIEPECLTGPFGILLSVNRTLKNEYTADGRQDNFGASTVVYTGHHYIKAP